MEHIEPIIEYLLSNITDPVPNFILVKELCKKDPSSPDYINAYRQMQQSKWYRELADEQREDGSWGRFHTQDTKAPVKRKFVTTEAALRRARELSLPKDDPIVAKCIKYMERIVRGEETWTDNIEKHHDNGKSHMRARLFVTAADINVFDPENPVVGPMRDVFVRTLEIALSKGCFDEETWERENRDYRGPCLTGWNAYPLMILQGADCMDDEVQRKYLNYIWHRQGGVYYLADFPPASIKCLDDKKFWHWLYLLEHLSGFSLFPEFMREDALPHLLGEIDRLIHEDIVVNTVRYAEGWRDKLNRKTDTLLRIARVVVKC